jgi:hypothetical protein
MRHPALRLVADISAAIPFDSSREYKAALAPRQGKGVLPRVHKIVDEQQQVSFVGARAPPAMP